MRPPGCMSSNFGDNQSHYSITLSRMCVPPGNGEHPDRRALLDCLTA
jgi:hypothetical protein